MEKGFFRALEKLTNLTFLDLGVMEIPEYCPTFEWEYTIRNLDDERAIDDGFRAHQLVEVLEIVKNHKNLTHVNLSEHNHVTREVVDALMDVIKHNTKLETLLFSDDDMKDLFTLEVVNSLRWNSTLKVINLKRCFVNGEVREKIEEIQNENTKISIVVRDKE